MSRIAQMYEFACRVVLLVLVVHIAFLVFSLAGLIILGVFPAFSATIATYRAWVRDVKDRRWSVKQTWKLFFHFWKDDLVWANIVGYPLTLIAVFLFVDYMLVNNNYLGAPTYAVSGILLLLNVVYSLFATLVWVVRANFDEDFFWILKQTLTLVIVRPLCSLMLIIMLLLVLFSYAKWPGLALAFGVSVPLFAVVVVVYSFARLPGMDIHVLEPNPKLAKKRNQQRDR